MVEPKGSYCISYISSFTGNIKCLKDIRVCSCKKVTWSIVHLMYLCTDAHRMGNKQGELEATVQLAHCDLILVTKRQWKELHN